MRDSTERDLAVANDLGHMADVRVTELEAEVGRLREALTTLRHHLQKQPDVVRLIDAALGEGK